MKTHVRKDAGRPAPTPSLYVEGRLEYRSFHDEEGKERGVCEIVASDVQFLGKRGASPETAPAADAATPLIGTTDDVLPEEIPF